MVTYETAIETLRLKTATVLYPIDLPEATVLKHDGETLTSIACSWRCPHPPGFPADGG